MSRPRVSTHSAPRPSPRPASRRASAPPAPPPDPSRPCVRGERVFRTAHESGGRHAQLIRSSGSTPIRRRLIAPWRDRRRPRLAAAVTSRLNLILALAFACRPLARYFLEAPFRSFWAIDSRRLRASIAKRPDPGKFCVERASVVKTLEYKAALTPRSRGTVIDKHSWVVHGRKVESQHCHRLLPSLPSLRRACAISSSLAVA